MNQNAKDERLYMLQYKAFTELYRAANYEAICASIIEIPTTTALPKYYTHYEAQISTSLFALSKSTTNTPQSLATHITHLTSCFVQMLQTVTATKDLITALNLLSNLEKKEAAFSILGTHCSNFLKGIRRSLQMLLLKTKKTSELIAGLTKCLCVFAKVEFANNENTMVQTTQFLNVIKEAAVNLGIITWKSLDCVYRVPPNMEHFQYELNIISGYKKELSVDDENVIFSAAVVLLANKSQIASDQKTITYTMNSLSILSKQLSIATEPSTPIFCNSCTLNFKEHAIIETTLMAQSVFASYCKTLSPIDGIWEACAKMTALQLNTIRSIQNCRYYDAYKGKINFKLTQICNTLSENKIFAASGVKFLAHVIEHCDIHEYVAHYVLMRSVFATYEKLETPQHLNLIHAGYILAAIILLEPRQADLLKYVMFRICDAQAKLADVPSVEEYFNESKYRYKNRVPFPQVSISELLLCQLRHSVYIKSFSEEMKAKISNAVRHKTKAEPMQFLRLVYSYENSQPTKKQYENLLSAYSVGKQNARNLSKSVQLRWHSLVGAMEHLSYRVSFHNTTEMYKSEPLNLKEERHIFRDLNLTYEANMLRMLLASLQAFKNLDTLLTKENVDSLRDEAEHAVRELMQLATHLRLREYRKDLMVAYTVLYSLSTKLNDEFGYFAALGYFAGNSRDYPDDMRSRNSLKKIIESNLKTLVDVWKGRERLSLRKQSSLLMCLMNIGFYYMEQGNIDNGKEILRYVEEKMTEFEAQFKIPYNNSIRMRFNTINLKLITKFDLHSPFPPIRLAEHILQNIKNMKYLTTLDTVELPSAFKEAIVFIARYCLARYDFDEIELVLQMLVKQAIRQGFVYSAAKMIAMCALFDLYKEDSVSCLMTLKNLDNIVTLFDNNNESAVLDIEKSGKCLTIPTSRSQQNSPARKQIGRCMSPIKVLSGGHEIPFEKYLIEHHAGCDCVHCSNGLIKELLLEMAWLNARSFFVSSDFKNCSLAFEYLHKYWTVHNDLQKVDGEIGCFIDRLSFTNSMMFWHYGQSLMRVGKAREASEMLASAVKWYRNCDYVDFAMEHDITKQLEDIYNVLGNDLMMVKPIKLSMCDEAVAHSAPLIHVSTVTETSIESVIKLDENTNPVVQIKQIKSSPTKIATSTKKTTKVEPLRAKTAKPATKLPSAISNETKPKNTKTIVINCDDDYSEKELKTTARRKMKTISIEQEANQLVPDNKILARSSRRLRKQ